MNSKKGSSYLRQRKLKRYSFIDKEKSNFPVRLLCQVLEVSPSGLLCVAKKVGSTAKLAVEIVKTISQKLLF